MVGLKAEVRREWLRRREASTPELRAARSRRVQNRFLELEPFVQGSSVALYSPVRGEVDTSLIFERAKRAGKRLAFPVTRPEGGRLDFHWVEDLGQLTPGRFGILEPDAAPGTRVDPKDLDVIAVPGVAFDRSGRRLGYGGGYYDRLLASPSTRPKCVLGIAFDSQILDEVPHDDRDAPMDGVVAESTVYSRVIFVGTSLDRSLLASQGV